MYVNTPTGLIIFSLKTILTAEKNKIQQVMDFSWISYNIDFNKINNIYSEIIYIFKKPELKGEGDPPIAPTSQPYNHH